MDLEQNVGADPGRLETCVLKEDDRFAQYAELVCKRKLCRQCDGLTNPSVLEDGKYDSDQIGAWSLWQGNLKAKLLVVGQDWGDVGYAKDFRGRDDPGSTTNQNLIKLFNSRGYPLEMPDYEPDYVSDYFFTNGIVCLKNGKDTRSNADPNATKKKTGMQSAVKRCWYSKCGPLFLRPLIEIVSPKILISLGEEAYRGIMRAYDRCPTKFSDAVDGLEPLDLSKDLKYFPVYHCSDDCLNRNRNLGKQLKDWTKIPHRDELIRSL